MAGQSQGSGSSFDLFLASMVGNKKNTQPRNKFQTPHLRHSKQDPPLDNDFSGTPSVLNVQASYLSRWTRMTRVA